VCVGPSIKADERLDARERKQKKNLNENAFCGPHKKYVFLFSLSPHALFWPVLMKILSSSLA